jgi:NitT/TauT family transport system ATP-binding protein
MKLVSGLLPPTSGAVFVDGARVTRPIRGVGMVFQNPMLMPWRSTLRNVLLPLEVVSQHRKRLRRARDECVAEARALLASVGLRDFENKFPWQLSGGMQQRASLCRAIIHQPDILMLDEPFGALDSFTREELWQALQKLYLERKLTVVLVTHDLREALFLADVIYVMSGRPGRVVTRTVVDFPRPRSLDLGLDPRFTRMVHDLRELIADARTQERAS